MHYAGVDAAGENVLQKHVAFFDRNKDGVVYPWETFTGFRAIGANLLLSTVSAAFINIGLSSKTRPVIIFYFIYLFIFKKYFNSDFLLFNSHYSLTLLS